MTVQHQSFHAWILTVTKSLLFSTAVSSADTYTITHSWNCRHFRIICILFVIYSFWSASASGPWASNKL